MAALLFYLGLDLIVIALGVFVAKRMPTPELSRTVSFLAGTLCGAFNLLAIQAWRPMR